MIEQLTKLVEGLKDTDIVNLVNLLKTWTDFQSKGGTIGGDISIPTIGAIGTAIKGNQDNIANLTPKVREWTDFQTNGGTIGGDIRLSVGLVGATITNHGDRLRSVESTNDTQGTDISNLKRDVNGHTTSITNLTNLVNGHTSTINTLGTRISTWETFKNSGGDIGGDIRLPIIGSVANRIESNTQEINGIKESIVGNKPIVINDSIPVGTIMFRNSGASLPSGWLLCNGNAVLQSDYPELYAVLGKTYGGDATRFVLPLMVDGSSMLVHGEKGTDHTISKVIGQQGIIKAKSTASEQIDIAVEWDKFITTGGAIGGRIKVPSIDAEQIVAESDFIQGLYLNMIKHMSSSNGDEVQIGDSNALLSLVSPDSPKALIGSEILTMYHSGNALETTYGTWSPVLYEGDGGNLPTSHDSTGSYWVKIGKMVIAHFIITLPPNASHPGWIGSNILLKWLPFPLNRTLNTHPISSISYHEGFQLPADSIGITMFKHVSADSFWVGKSTRWNGYTKLVWGDTVRDGTITLSGTITYYTN